MYCIGGDEKRGAVWGLGGPGPGRGSVLLHNIRERRKKNPPVKTRRAWACFYVMLCQCMYACTCDGNPGFGGGAV